jgi:hypothetical protein
MGKVKWGREFFVHLGFRHLGWKRNVVAARKKWHNDV